MLSNVSAGALLHFKGTSLRPKPFVSWRGTNDYTFGYGRSSEYFLVLENCGILNGEIILNVFWKNKFRTLFLIETDFIGVFDKYFEVL